MAVHIGDTLKGRYKIIESLGRGGMADVYKVWDEERSTYLALKLLRDDLAQDPVFMRRFKREAHNLAQLQHPNIVRFYGLEVDDLKAFILMEYIEGTTLREEILRAGAGGLGLGRVQQVMGDVCSALQYAHNKGLVHCDIKSGNILVDASGKAYLTDFGIARGMDAATSTMVGIGTPAYMAPELIKGQDPTPQTDIYALGIVLYEMLTGGERPFTGERATITGTTAEKVRWEHLNLDPNPVTTVNSSAIVSFEKIIKTCLEKIPCDRYSNVIDLIDSVETIKDNGSYDLNDYGQKKEESSDDELNREQKNVIVYKKEKKKNKGNRTGWVVGILFICVGALTVIVNYQSFPWKSKKIDTKPVVEDAATQVGVIAPTATFEKELHQITPLPSLKNITQENINGLQEVNRMKVGNYSIERMSFSEDGDFLWILDNADFISLSTQTFAIVDKTEFSDSYDDDEIYLNSTYHVLGNKIYSNSDARLVFEIPDGNRIIGFSEDNSIFFTYFIMELRNNSEFWKVKVWDLQEGKNICNTTELSTYGPEGTTYLVNWGSNFITSEKAIYLEKGNEFMGILDYSKIVSLWNSANCKKIDVMEFASDWDYLSQFSESSIWVNKEGETLLLMADNGKLVTSNNTSAKLMYETPNDVKSLILKKSEIIIFSYENTIEFRDLQTLSLIDSFLINEKISSIVSNSDETILLVGTNDGTIVQYGVLH